MEPQRARQVLRRTHRRDYPGRTRPRRTRPVLLRQRRRVTLGGVNYPYSGRYAPDGAQYLADIWILTDTSSYVPYLYTDPFTHITRQLYETTTDVTAVIGYNGQPLAVVTGPLELRGIPTLDGAPVTGPLTSRGLFNPSTYDGVFYDGGPNMLELGLSFPTTLGEFTLTSAGEEGLPYYLPLNPDLPLPGTTTTPEPSTLALVITGAIGGLAQLRRRRAARP